MQTTVYSYNQVMKMCSFVTNASSARTQMCAQCSLLGLSVLHMLVVSAVSCRWYRGSSSL